jgi:hypothetical protein
MQQEKLNSFGNNMNDDNKSLITTGIGVILLGIGLLLITPFIFLWAVNGLFALHIEYTWTNWFYAIIILCFVRGKVSSK